MELISNDPASSSYYYPTIIVYLVLFLAIHLIIHLYKNNSKTYRARALSHSLDAGKDYSEDLVREKKWLKIKYLSAYILARAAMWAKAPYLYMLYNKYHGFSVSEIGVLYVIDAVSGLISGPILGSFADKFGRKLFCMNYCVFVFSNLGLRLTGSRPLAYVAQVLTGFGSGLINSTFESWLVCESKKVFGDLELENERFLKRLFKNQNLYDAVCSLVVSAVSAVIFTLYGVLATIIFSMSLSALTFFIILFMWDENRPLADAGDTAVINAESFKEALAELKNRDVLSIGIIESFFQACLNLFTFCWTPLLQRSTASGDINVGFIFVCYVLMMVIGTAVFELFVITLRTRYYISMVFSILTNTIMWYLIYAVDSFILRLIFLSIINGQCGFYLPLNSIIKSKILVEKHRATLMNIFRIPVNLYVIVALLALKFMDAFHICLISLGMMICATILTMSLYFYPPRPLETDAKPVIIEDLVLKFNDDIEDIFNDYKITTEKED